MDKRVVYLAILISLILHTVMGATASQFSDDPYTRKKRVTVAVVGKTPEKKKELPKPTPPPPPPPPPKAVKVAPKVVEAAPPPPEPAHAVEHEAAPRAPMVGLEWPTTGPGVDVGGTEVKGPKPGQQDALKPTAVKKPTAVQKPHEAEPEHTAGDGPAPCTEDATKPEPIQKTDIEYTEEARANGVEARLGLKITIDENGAVSDVAVASSVDPSLDAAAIAAVKQWRFKPSMKCGKPVAGTYTLARRFELGD